MLPLLGANASSLDPCSSQLSDGRWIAPAAVSCGELGYVYELALRAKLGLIHAVVREGAGPVGGRELRQDPASQRHAARWNNGGRGLVAKAGRSKATGVGGHDGCGELAIVGGFVIF